MNQMITQEDDMGCGTACVAMALNLSYEECVALLGEVKARTVGFQLKELKQVLNAGGRNYKSSHINWVEPDMIHKDGTIVFIKRSKAYPYGHFLIRTNGKWGDPWINLCEDDTIERAYSGFRNNLPGDPQWLLLPG